MLPWVKPMSTRPITITKKKDWPRIFLERKGKQFHWEQLEKNDVMLREGSIVDATIISASNFTKIECDMEMHLTKKLAFGTLA